MNGIFDDLATMKRWVPYRLVYNPKREKFDKIPHTGRHGLSTAVPTDWMTFTDAWEASEGYGLSGVGFVFTGGVEYAGWTLVGFDFDGVKFDEFKPPFESYWEKSPSGEGARMLAWAPVPWVKQFKDTTNIKYPGCEHLEIYLGTAPRFLTITFNVMGEHPIKQLTPNELKKLERLGIEQAIDETPQPLALPHEAGKPINPRLYDLNPEQRHLVDGTGNIDRSAVLHGLIIKLIDSGVTPNDVFATLLKSPALWAYCLSHRDDKPDRAMEFARNEVTRAYEKSNIGMKTKLVAFNADWSDKPKPVKQESPELAFPQELFDEAPGLVGEIAKWILGASYAPRKEFAYAAALSATACLIGPYCSVGSRDGKLNLYLVLVGGTGTGKNEAIDPMGKLLSFTEAKDCITDFPASEAALRRQLNIQPNVLIRMDELAHKLESMKDNSNGNLLGKAMLELYNGARLPPKAYADARNNLPAVDNPFVQILGGTTDKVWEVVRTAHMEDGTLNRFIFVSLPENPEYSSNDKPSYEVSKEFKDRINNFWRIGKQLDMIGNPDMGRIVKIAPEVDARIIEIKEALWPMQQKEYGALYTRFVQNTLKVAAILAVGDGKLVVEMCYFEHARKFVAWSIATTLSKASMYMADSNFERLAKRVINKLKKEGGRMRLRNAYRTTNTTRRETDEIIATLEASGKVTRIEGERNKNGSVTEWLVLLDGDLDDE